MNKVVKTTVFSLMLALCLTSTSMIAFGKTKLTAEQKVAIKKCNDDFKAATTQAKSKKGKERTEALEAAKKSHQECLATAHK